MENGFGNETRDETSVADASMVTALMVKNWYEKEQQAVDAFLEEKKYSFRKGRKASLTSVTGYYVGQQAGEKINLNQQLESSTSIKLLT